MRRYLILAAVLILSTLVAVAFIGPRLFTSPIARAEERWYEAARSDYRMTIEVQCFCSGAPAYTVIVRGNQPIRAVADGRRLSLRIERAVGTTLTVGDLFMLVHELIAEHGSDNVEVTYDPQWGYPATIVTGGEANAIDDELSLTVTRFQEGR